MIEHYREEAKQLYRDLAENEYLRPGLYRVKEDGDHRWVWVSYQKEATFLEDLSTDHLYNLIRIRDTKLEEVKYELALFTSELTRRWSGEDENIKT